MGNAGTEHPSYCLQPGNPPFSVENSQPDVPQSSCCLNEQGSHLIDN